MIVLFRGQSVPPRPSGLTLCRRLAAGAGLAVALALAGCQQNPAAQSPVDHGVSVPGAAANEATSSNTVASNTDAQLVVPQDVVAHYAELAYAIYQDSLVAANALQQSVQRFLAEPTETNLTQARLAWKQARVPYQQSEAFRFGNPVVDEWEGQVNAWPLDEGLIDYVAPDSYYPVLGNPGANANIVGKTRLEIAGRDLDLAQITPELLISLNEFGGSEANVATGYHAIEFLLWGQDLQGDSAGAGMRPATDYSLGSACTHGHCQRRADYLRAVTQLLVDDLRAMVAQWAPDGPYRQQLKREDPNQGLRRMLFSMGSLSLGELAGERMKVALEANSPEDEHDCFSDNTHNSHFYNALGIHNIYHGEYRRIDGSRLAGPALADLAHSLDPQLDSQIRDALQTTQRHLQAMVDSAEHSNNPMPFDLMIMEGNAEGARLIKSAISALVEQTRLFEQLGATLELGNLNPGHASLDVGEH